MASRPKFDGVDFSTSEYPVHQMTPGSEQALGRGFDCIRPEFATYFKRGKVSSAIAASTCQCWALVHPDGMAGYITLMADKLEIDSRPILKKEGLPYLSFPAVKIGWLASDKRARKAGKRLVQWALAYTAIELAPRLGVRFVTLDAFYDRDATPHYDVSGFYYNLGFRYTRPDEELPPAGNFRTMYYDLKPSLDAIRAIGEQQAAAKADAEAPEAA